VRTPAEIHEGRDFEVDVRRLRVEKTPDRVTHFGAAREGIAVIKPPRSITAQRLLATDIAFITADAAKGPETGRVSRWGI